MNRSRIVYRIALVIALFVLLVFSFCFERIPLANGLGWDGVIYDGMIRGFLEQIQGEGYPAYYLQKCLPFALINVFDTILHISNSFMTLAVFELLAFALGVIAFFRTSSYLKLSIGAEIVAFALLFFTHSVLRIGYMPYLDDPFAFCLGLWTCYFFVSKQFVKMVVVSAVGAFVWNSIWIVCLVMLAMPTLGFNLFDGKNVSTIGKKRIELFKLLLTMGLVCIPLSMLLIAQHKNGNWMVYANLIPFYYWHVPVKYVFVSTICNCMLFFVAIRPFVFNPMDFMKTLMRNLKISNVIAAVVLCVLMQALIRFLSNPQLIGPESFLSGGFVRRLLYEPFTVPLKFLASHVAYDGILVCMLFVLYKEAWIFVSEFSIGYVVVFAMALCLGTQYESRFILNFFPFIVFPIAAVITRKQLKKWVPGLVCLVQLFLSGFWFRANTEGLAEALESDDVTSYTSGVAQRVCYSNGMGMGECAYYVFLLIFVVITVLLFVGKKRGWFVVRTEATEVAPITSE